MNASVYTVNASVYKVNASVQSECVGIPVN